MTPCCCEQPGSILRSKCVKDRLGSGISRMYRDPSWMLAAFLTGGKQVICAREIATGVGVVQQRENHAALRDLNRSATNIPSKCRIASIVLNDAMILPDEANPRRMEFSGRTRRGDGRASEQDSKLVAGNAHGCAVGFLLAELLNVRSINIGRLNIGGDRGHMC